MEGRKGLMSLYERRMWKEGKNPGCLCELWRCKASTPAAEAEEVFCLVDFEVRMGLLLFLLGLHQQYSPEH
ncbi:hypothetical protein LINGRAHAP2_LOCUS34348 [Linum grandiflorum]